MQKTFFAILVCGFSIYYLRIYLKGTPCNLYNKIIGKTVIITGATTGSGYETALELAKRGGKIIMTCRNMKKCNQAAKSIKIESKNNQIIAENLDLASLKSVRDFTMKFKKAHAQLDILILNAGLFNTEFHTTMEGLENTFGVNHVGHFALAYLLLDVLQNNPSPPSRMIVVSSIANEIGNLILPQPYSMNETNFSIFGSYSRSKLANILFAREATKRWKNIVSVSLHPGVFSSHLGRSIPEFIQIVGRPIFNLFIKNNKDGAQTSICCALDPNLEQKNGKYFMETIPQSSLKNPQATNDTLAEHLWNWTESFVQKKLQNLKN